MGFRTGVIRGFARDFSVLVTVDKLLKKVRSPSEGLDNDGSRPVTRLKGDRQLNPDTFPKICIVSFIERYRIHYVRVQATCVSMNDLNKPCISTLIY